MEDEIIDTTQTIDEAKLQVQDDMDLEPQLLEKSIVAEPTADLSNSFNKPSENGGIKRAREEGEEDDVDGRGDTKKLSLERSMEEKRFDLLEPNETLELADAKIDLEVLEKVEEEAEVEDNREEEENATLEIEVKEIKETVEIEENREEEVIETVEVDEDQEDEVVKETLEEFVKSAEIEQNPEEVEVEDNLLKVQVKETVEVTKVKKVIEVVEIVEVKDGKEEANETAEDGEDDEVKETLEGEEDKVCSAIRNVGPKVFSSSVEMFDYFYKLLHEWPTNLNINKYEHTILLDLLKNGHSDSVKKIGVGIEAFQVRYHQTFKSKCFFLLRSDGSTDDFSFRKCVDKILPLPDNMKVPSASSNGKKAWGGQQKGRGGGRGRGGRGGGNRGR